MLPIVDFYLRQQQNEEENGRRRGLIFQRRQLRVHSNPFNLPDNQFIELFRLNKNLVHNLIENLTPHMNATRYRSAITVDTKILTALRFYATGSYQRSVGEDYHLGLSQTSVHRCIQEITNLIDTNLAGQHIKFPNLREFNSVKETFMDKFQFPGVIGAVDGTHIAILKLSVDEHNFINRKGFHSLNVQIISDSNLKIMNVNANYPGSSHDSFIWRQSQVKDQLHQLYTNGNRGFWLIGDSGYPLQPYLMIPFLNPAENSPESRYNFRHASARNCVERCIGLLKMRFRCILKERTARYTPQFVARLVNACATLHNMCIEENVPLLENNLEEQYNNNNFININANMLNEGRHVRETIVNRYFR